MEDSVLLSTLLQQIAALRAEMNQRFSDLEAQIFAQYEKQDVRISRIEYWQGKVTGGLAFGLVALQVVFRFIWK